jgi:hypothetical protein
MSIRWREESKGLSESIEGWRSMAEVGANNAEEAACEEATWLPKARCCFLIWGGQWE